MGIRSLLEDLGVETKILVNTDASAAKGIASRRGLGKVRHVRVQQLWLQERVNSGEVRIRKVPGITNMADAFTKTLEPGELEFHMKEVGIVWEQGRHYAAPEVSSKNDDSCEEEGEHEGIRVCREEAEEKS